LSGSDIQAESLRLYLDLCTSTYFALDDGRGKILAARVVRPPLRNEEVLDAVTAGVAEAGRRLAEIGAIAVAAGPGSFTGIRVGIALAQGLAFARKLPLHAFSSLGAVQANFAHDPDALTAIPAHGGRWYIRYPGREEEILLSSEALSAWCREQGKAPALQVSGALPKNETDFLHFSRVLAMEDAPNWPALFAFAFAHGPSPLGIIHPRYVQASAAEAKRLGSEAEPSHRLWKEEDMTLVAGLEGLCNPVPWSFSALLHHFHAGGLGGLLAVGDEKVGYWVAQKIDAEAEVLLLGIAPSWRRRGLASSLLKRLLAHLQSLGVKTVHLEVRSQNAAALALYARWGFAKVGLRKRYYADNGDDALLLRLNLPGHY